MTNEEFERLKNGDIVSKKIFPSGKIVKGEVKGIDRAVGCIIMYHHLANSDNRVETRGPFKDFTVEKVSFYL